MVHGEQTEAIEAASITMGLWLPILGMTLLYGPKVHLEVSLALNEAEKTGWIGGIAQSLRLFQV